MRVVFMGTPDFSVAALKNLIQSEHEVIAVYSQPPRPKGRGHQVQKSPVHQLADEHGIPVFTPKSFKKDLDAVEHFRSLKADIAAVVAYGLILPVSVLEAPVKGCLNIHASLLPRWRGASPIQHSIWKGDEKTGVTIMQMEAGLDTGPMLLKRDIEIGSMNVTQLHDALSIMGAEMIVEVLKDIPQGEVQDDSISNYAPMLKKEDGIINWADRCVDIDRQIRALNPWPGTFTQSNDKRIKILSGTLTDETAQGDAGTVLSKGRIICGDGRVYKIEIVQPENSKAMDVASAINGKYLIEGVILK